MKHYKLTNGLNKNGQNIFTLLKTHFDDGTEMREPEYIKLWENEPTQEQIDEQILLNDWSRWNTELPKGQKVEISEAIYFTMLNCLPPRNWKDDYFEVGEPHHHESGTGKPIHRACWIEEGKHFIGYPKN